MAKKATKPVNVTSIAPEAKTTRPVRLDLTLADHERLETNAKRLGLSKSSYVRMALFERMKADEAEERREAK